MAAYDSMSGLRLLPERTIRAVDLVSSAAERDELFCGVERWHV